MDLPYSGRIDAMEPDGARVEQIVQGGVVARPAGSDGVIYVPTPAALYLVDATTGAVEDTWQDAPSSGEPVLTDDSVYVHTASKLMAFDRQTHHLRWTHDVSAEATPAVSGGTVYEPISTAQLVALDASAGEVVWGPVASSGSPSVGDGKVFTIGGGTIRAFDALTGAAAWSASAQVDTGIPAVANGTVYAMIGDRPSLFVEAFDDATGAKEWTTKVDGRAQTNITLVNGLVFASTSSGVFVLNKRGIELIKLVTYLAWSGGSSPTVVNGHVSFDGCGKRCAFATWSIHPPSDRAGHT